MILSHASIASVQNLPAANNYINNYLVQRSFQAVEYQLFLRTVRGGKVPYGQIRTCSTPYPPMQQRVLDSPSGPPVQQREIYAALNRDNSVSFAVLELPADVLPIDVFCSRARFNCRPSAYCSRQCALVKGV